LPRPVRASAGESGFSLIEAITAIVIVAVSLIGLYQAFGYGRLYIEKMGIRRQALCMVQAEMEYWRDIAARNPDLLSAVHANERVRTALLGEERKLRAFIEPHVGNPAYDNGLRYREVSVALTYDGGNFGDSLGLCTKMYEVQ
jgi:hypothetical protein